MKNRERWFSGYYVVKHGEGDGEPVLRIEFKNAEEEPEARHKAFALFHKFNVAGQNSMVQRCTSESQVIVYSEVMD
jgi:hypothetical protein